MSARASYGQIASLLLLLVIAGCEEDDPAIPTNDDFTAPSDVTDLAGPSTTLFSIALTWTAPGDNGTDGTAAAYDIRYSDALITEANFDSATQAGNAPAPTAGGTTQTFSITGLAQGTTYFVALKAADDASNWSGLSNVINATTLQFQTPQFVLEWGEPGGGNGNFDTPTDVAVDAARNVYVTDSGNRRVQKFDANGGYLTQWGSSGAGDGQFNNPIGITVSAAGDVYVVDQGNARIQKFDAAGAFVTKWGTFGTGDGQFRCTVDIAVDAGGNVYVAEVCNYRIQKFTAAGAYLTQWGSIGSGDGQFITPSGVAVDGDGNVYVTDSDTDRVQKFDGVGTFLSAWGSSGTGDGAFDQPSGIDARGTLIYVTDLQNDRVQIFDSDSNFLTKFGSPGTGDGQFTSVAAVAVGNDGSVYVVDASRIQKFE
jgi:hypothetical protein